MRGYGNDHLEFCPGGDGVLIDAPAQIVPFVHPGLAAAAVATGLIPIAIHLINRRRYREVPWAAMTILLASYQKSKRRLRLEQLLLLLLRVLAIVLLGLALARPIVPAEALLAMGSSAAHRIIVFDNSLSMATVDAGGVTRFDRARDAAGELIASFPESDAVSVLLLCDRDASAHRGQPSFDRRIIREGIGQSRVSYHPADFVGTFARATELARESDMPRGNRIAYFISDTAASDWSSDRPDSTAAIDAAKKLASEATLMTIVVPPGIEENVAITQFSHEEGLLTAGLPIRLHARLANYGDAPARNVVVQLRTGRTVIREQEVPMLSSGDSTDVSFTTAFSKPGSHSLEVRVQSISRDALTNDNSRFLSIDVADTTPVLLVDGAPGATRLKGEAGYLAYAIAPRTEGAERVLLDPKIIGELELASEALNRYRVIALCNVQRLSTEQWNRISAFVADGGGLAVFSGNLLDLSNYNQQASTGSAALLPCRFEQFRIVGDDDAPLRFSPEDLRHPVVADFEGFPESGLFSADVSRYIDVEPTGPEASVIMRYANASPALVIGSHGKGSVAVFTTSADMAWNNLPARGDYVSLMTNLMAFLTRNPGAHRNLLVGKALIEPLTPEQSSAQVRVRPPDGRAGSGRIVPYDSRLALEYTDVDEPGVYEMTIGMESVYFAANVPLEESDVAAIPLDAARKLFAEVSDSATVVTTDDMISAGEARLATQELSTIALAIVGALLIVESWLAMKYGPGGATPRRRRVRATEFS